MNPDRKILLNPGPATTSQSVKEALVVSDICPRENAFGNLMKSIQKALIKIVKGEKNYTAVLFSGSGTASMEAVISSAIPKKNGKLLIVENGAYGSRMVEICKVYQIPFHRYKIPYGTFPDCQAIEKILIQDSEISHLAVVHHETTTGMLNPVNEILALCKKHKIKTIVDAMSSFAGIPIDLQKNDFDYLIASSNKCIQGMAGLSFVIFKEKLLEEIKENRRNFYLDIFAQHQYFSKNNQMQFTPPVQIAYALKKAIEEYFQEGEKKRFERYQKNWEILYQGMKKMGFKPLLPLSQESKILISIIEPKHKNYNFNEMHDFLFQKGFTIYPGKMSEQNTFRLSVLGDLYAADIRAFLDAMKLYLEDQKILLS